MNQKDWDEYLEDDENFNKELDQVLDKGIPDEEKFLTLCEEYFSENGDPLNRSLFLYFYKEASQ